MPAKELGIEAVLVSQGPRLLEVRLSLSDRFVYAIKGADSSLKNRLEAWLQAYAAGVYTPFLPAPALTFFTRKTLDFLTSIPFGSTLSYSQVADALGHKKASRAVGNACRVNPFPLLIPCHRVVAASGRLGGFSCGLEIKKRLLDFESSF